MLNTLEMERYIAATARRGNLHVKWGEPGTVPRTNGQEMHLPAFTNNTDRAQYNKLRHYATHEVDHVLYTDFQNEEGRGCDPSTGLLGALWNLVEDHRIEFLGTSEYEGDRLASNEVHGPMIEACSKNISKQQKEVADSLLPSLAWANGAWSDCYPSATAVQGNVEKLLTPEGQAVLDKFKAGPYRQMLEEAREIADPTEGTQATLDVAKRIYKEVFNQDPDAELKRCQQKHDQEQKGKGGKKKPGDKPGDGDEGEGAEGDGDGKAEGDKAKSGEGKPGGKREKFLTVDYSALVPDPHTSRNRSEVGMHLNYDNYTRGAAYTPSRNDEYTVHDLTKTSLSGSHTSGKITHKVANSSAGFAHKVRTILQIRARDKYSYAQKRGKLNSSSLHRIVVPNAPGYADRVFKRREVNNVLDAAVTLVVDQSGSMAGEKYYNAGAAAAMLSDTIANTLHIPVEIVSFTSMRDNVLYVHRTFKDKLVPRDKLIARLGYSAEQGMDGNADGDAIMWAFDRLVKRPEKRKLVVVFSEVSPSGCGGRGDIGDYTRQVVKGIENESPVDIVGIGIMDRNVELFYKENYVIDDSSQLETALLSLIENKLK